MQKKLKFKIKYLLDNLPYNQRQQAIYYLRYELNVSKATFDRILYAKQDSTQEISATNLLKVANFFNTSPFSIMGQPVQILSTYKDFE